MKPRILFLCTGNSCRSQMAEVWAKHLKADVLEAHSAGTHPKELDLRAVKAMAEVGIDRPCRTTGACARKSRLS